MTTSVVRRTFVISALLGCTLAAAAPALTASPAHPGTAHAIVRADTSDSGAPTPPPPTTTASPDNTAWD